MWMGEMGYGSQQWGRENSSAGNVQSQMTDIFKLSEKHYTPLLSYIINTFPKSFPQGLIPDIRQSL